MGAHDAEVDGNGTTKDIAAVFKVCHQAIEKTLLRSIRRLWRDKAFRARNLGLIVLHEPNSKERIREVKKRYRRRHLKKFAAAQRSWKERNPEKAREADRRYKEKLRQRAASSRCQAKGEGVVLNKTIC